MNTIFIINRFAGNGNGQKIAEYIENNYRGLPDVKIEYTLYRGHATQIARQYANTNSLIYAVGGDGTLNEVVNGMMSTKCNSILSTVPCGSGRDFARNFTDEKDPKYFLQSNLEEYQIDVGEIDYGYSSRYFINAVAAGITAEIGERANFMSRGIPPKLKYLLSIPGSLATYKFPNYKLIESSHSMEEQMTTIMISTGKYIGGGFEPAPYASLDDGLFDITIKNKFFRFGVIPLAIRLKIGKHLSKLSVPQFKTDDITLYFDEPTILNVDGEVIFAREANCHQAKEKTIKFRAPKGK